MQDGRHGLSGKHFTADGYPAFGAGGLNGRLPTFEFDRTAVVLSAIGARCGKCFLTEGKWTSLANTQVIAPDEQHADIRFLWFQLNDEARWRRSGTAQPFIKPSDVKAHSVYLPPLPEQRRIAAILDQADALRSKRKAALAHLDELTFAAFFDLFVHNQAKSADWPQVSISSLACSIRTGPFGSQLLHSEFIDAGIAVLGIDNAVFNEFKWGGRRFITGEKYRQLSRYRVHPGDVIITIMGTCGRAAVVPDDIPTAITTKHLCSITLDRSRCLPAYLQACFTQHPTVLRQLGVNARGAVMPGLNMELIKGTVIPLPPLSRQEELSRRLDAIKEVRRHLDNSAAATDALFASLQHRAFRGEL